ncbi:MAG: hypothetical protein EA362_10320 [Saprospirales bacterium]|nr:MAG: hypothetical protein EA362_10320 [Saprospirales bacterium]
MIIFVFSACSDDDGPVLDVVPKIELLGISSDTIVEFEDVLVISIQYSDGDGDIGFEDPDINSIFVRDARLEDYDGFYIGPVAPPDQEIPVTGTLNIEFPALFLFGTGATENTRFYVYLVDRAGNESNEVITQTVTIIRE